MARFQFIQEIAQEYLGVEYLSAVLKQAGHHVDVLIGNSDAGIVKGVAEYRPDAACFSAITGPHRWCMGKAEAIKAAFPSVRVIFGGGHPTFFPEMIRHPSVDMIVRGEAEGAILDIARCIDERTDCRGVLNVWSRIGGEIVENPVRPYLTDAELDALPRPDRELYYTKYPHLARSAVKAFLGQRGCPYSCSFCLNDKLKELYRGKGPYVRRRSPGNIVAEIADVCAQYPVRTVHLYDEIFNTSPDWCMAVMDEYRRRVRRPYYCLVRADLMTREIAAKLKESGCAGAWMGVETGDEELRLKVLGKRLTDKQIVDAARMLHEAGIPFRAYCQIGLPDETIETAMKTVELCIRIKTDYPWCSVYQPYSKTGLVEYCIRKGYIPADFSVDRIDSNCHRDSVLKLPDMRRLMNLAKFFQTAVLFPRAIPLIRRLIRLPANPLYEFWFGAVYFFVYIRSDGRPFLESLSFALRYAWMQSGRGADTPALPKRPSAE